MNELLGLIIVGFLYFLFLCLGTQQDLESAVKEPNSAWASVRAIVLFWVIMGAMIYYANL